MNISSLPFSGLVGALIASSALFGPAYADEVGVNKLDPAIQTSIDNYVKAQDSTFGCSYLSVGLVYDGVLVYTKGYGTAISTIYQWASISKPAFGIIAMKMIEDGKIDSVDDNIWKYVPSYQSKMPTRYSNSGLTIAHILRHTSGIPHWGKPVFDSSGKFNLQFAPGSNRLYSSQSFEMLGKVLMAADGGRSYSGMLDRYIEQPVNATSMSMSTNSGAAPSYAVTSNIKDIMLFSIGVMSNTYISSSSLAQVRSRGLGFQTSGSYLVHGGTQSGYQNYLRIEPDKNLGVAILTKGCSDSFNDSRSGITSTLLSRMTSGGNPCVNNNCGSSQVSAPTPSPTPTVAQLKNNGFEDGLTSWKASGGRASVATVSNRSGSVLKLDPNGANWAEVGQTLPARAGDKYSVAGYIHVPSLTGGAACINVRYYDAAGNKVGADTYLETTNVRGNGGWTRYESGVLTAPTGTALVKARPAIRGDNLATPSLPAARGAAYFDDIVLLKK